MTSPAWPLLGPERLKRAVAASTMPDRLQLYTALVRRSAITLGFFPDVQWTVVVFLGRDYESWSFYDRVSRARSEDCSADFATARLALLDLADTYGMQPLQAELWAGEMVDSAQDTMALARRAVEDNADHNRLWQAVLDARLVDPYEYYGVV